MTKTKKLISIVLSLLLIVSAITVGTVSAAVQTAWFVLNELTISDFDDDNYVIDNSVKYVENTGTTTNKGCGFIAKTDSDGNTYATFKYQTASTYIILNSGTSRNHWLPLNESGVQNGKGAYFVPKAAGELIRVRFDYKMRVADANSVPTVKAGIWAHNNTWTVTNKGTGTFKVCGTEYNLSQTEEWTSVDMLVKIPEFTDGTDSKNMLSLRISSSENGVGFEVDLDNIYVGHVTDIVESDLTTQHLNMNFDDYTLTASGNVVKTDATPDSDNKEWGNYVLMSDSTQGKYLRFSTENGAGTAQKISYDNSMFALNPTGDYTDEYNQFELEPNSKYRISFKVKATTTSSTKNFMVGILAKSARKVGKSTVFTKWVADSSSGANTAATSTVTLSNPTGVIDKWSYVKYSNCSNWSDASFEFTTDNLGDNEIKSAYLFLHSTGSATIAIDDIIIDKLSTVTVKETGKDDVLKIGAPVSEIENRSLSNAYSDYVGDTLGLGREEDYTGTVGKLYSYYTDTNRTSELVLDKFPAKDTTAYRLVTSDTQVAFTGYDEIKKRTDVTANTSASGGGASQYYQFTNNIFRPDGGFEVVEADGYTGNKSLHYTPTSKSSNEPNHQGYQVIYIGSGDFKYIEGNTYKITFRIKKDQSFYDENADAVTSLKVTACATGDASWDNRMNKAENSVEVDLSTADEWTECSLYYTAGGVFEVDNGYTQDFYFGPALRFGENAKINAGFYIDAILVEDVTATYEGTIKGDIDNNGDVNLIDMLKTKKYVENYQIGDALLINVEYDGNKGITLADLKGMRNQLLQAAN